MSKVMEKMRAVIVIPFLNEQESIINTCHSLGFGLETNVTPRNSTLFMIDNGSTDNSLQIAKSIRDFSPKGSVIIGYESERGYVPPRHRGNLLAREYAKLNGWNERSTVILQADADTIYGENYVELMLSSTQGLDTNILLQAEARYPLEFESNFPEYIQICKKIDNQLEDLFADEAIDVMIDDKLSGYRLEDYFKWGGHQREYTLQGDEIHSETARLYIKARAQGAAKSPVSEAHAFPSMRKTIEEPALHFATAGFPRETAWKKKWRREYCGPNTISEFCKNYTHPEVQKSKSVRKQHTIAILSILPLHVSMTLGEEISFNDNELYGSILSHMPNRTTKDLMNTPGIFITDVFQLIDSEGAKLLESIL